MGTKHKPRSGSMGFYPRKRARRELATFRTMSALEQKPAKPLNFVGYKAGMVLVTSTNQQEKTSSFGQLINFPATVIECPPITVFGVRAYTKKNGLLQTLGETSIDKVDKHFRKKFSSFKKKSTKKKAVKEGKKERKEEKEKSYTSIEDLEKKVENISEIRLLCATKPSALDFGKKVPDVCEVFLGGNVSEQMAFAKEKLGKGIFIDEVFKEKQFVDVKAVDTGKGFCGVIKRFGVKIQRRKAKHRRIVGSISPWNPSTVMRTVARPGQLGYQSRTELNKRILKISDKPNEINVSGGFKGYGNVKSNYILLAGSSPGPSKRAISLREPTRKADESKFNVSELKIHDIGIKSKTDFEPQEEVKAHKVVVEKEKKKEKKSVEDEIKAAASGEVEKKEKKK